jgi:hypothetical protein
MQFSATKLKATATAVPNLKATAAVVRAGGTVATLKLLAQAAAAVLNAAVYAPALTLSVQAQLLKASAITGLFLRYLERVDEASLTDAATFRLQRSFEELTALADQATISLSRNLADSSAVTDAQIKAVLKGITDTCGFSDQVIVAFSKQTEEVLLVSDPIGKALSTGRSDTFYWGEGPAIDEYAIDYFLEDYVWSGRPHIEFIKGVSDVAGNFTDSHLKTFTKGVDEPVALSETFVRRLSRSLTEDIRVTDDIDGNAMTDDEQVMELRKAVSDLFAIGDTVFILMSWVRTFDDTAAATDAKTVNFGKAVSDAPAATDAATVQVAKVLTDAYAVTDAAAKSTAKSFSDAYAATDAAVKTTNKVISDIGALTDAAYNNMTKALADTAGTTDQRTFSLSRSLADSGAATDSVGKTIAPAKTDSASLTDAGAVRMQSYCDITYFAEDYVGVTFTF